MKEMIKMVVVLTLLSSFSGGLLAAVRSNTKDRIENQQLLFVRGPAIMSILEGAENDPIMDRFRLTYQERDVDFFIGVYNGKPATLVFENSGRGYGGDIGVMMGVSLESETIAGIGVTTHQETPGLGSKAKDDPAFARQFKGLKITDTIAVTSDGGTINAIGGATLTSRGVCGGASEALKMYQELKPQIEAQLAAFGG